MLSIILIGALERGSYSLLINREWSLNGEEPNWVLAVLRIISILVFGIFLNNNNPMQKKIIYFSHPILRTCRSSKITSNALIQPAQKPIRMIEISLHHIIKCNIDWRQYIGNALYQITRWIDAHEIQFKHQQVIFSQLFFSLFSYANRLHSRTL